MKQYLIDEFFLMVSDHIASNSSEAIRDSDLSSFGRHSQGLGLFNRQGFEGQGLPEVPEKPAINRKTAILV